MQRLLLAALFAAAALSAQGSLEGRVFNAVTGAPLKKVFVRLSGGQTQIQSRGQETDEQGRFQFANLPPGPYQLFAQRAGFLAQSYGARGSFGPGTTIAIGRDQHIADLTVRLTPQGVIAGRVLDEDGDPVANAQVMIYKQMYRDGKKQWSQTGGGNTSDIGEYRAANLEAGRFLVAAISRPPSFGSSPEEALPRKPELIYAATYYPNSISQQAGAPVDVTAGNETRGIDIHIARVPAFHVRGTVNGIPAGGARGASVSLLSRDGTGMNLNGQVQSPSNQFDISGVIPGQYTLFVHGGGAPPLTATQSITVASDHLTGLVLTVAPAFELPGRVRIAEADSSASVKNVRVILRPADVTAYQTGQVDAAPDAEGRLVFRNLSPGHYLVDVANPPGGCFVQSVKYGGQRVTDDGVEIASASTLEVVLSSTAATIGGSVTDKDGKPVPHATVALIPSDTALEQVAVVANEQGMFSNGHLSPGTYRAIAWEDIEGGAWMDPKFRKPYEGRAVEIQVGPGEQQNLQLHAIAVDEMTNRLP